MSKVIIVYSDGSYKEVDSKDSRTYEQDLDWLVTCIPNSLSVGEILQHIYDSEIHLKIDWMWDGGFDYSIGSTCDNYIQGNTTSTGETNIEKGVEVMAKDIAKQYPKSTFAKWWSSKK